MYSLSGYGQMIADAPRMAAYEAALRAAIRPGAVVLDIGAGPGIMALMALQMGAGHVYAVEPDSVIEVGREIARANGMDERITFMQDFSARVSLPQPADVIVSDLRGVMPLFQQHIPSLADARARLLAPGGVLIPRRDTLWAAPVHAPKQYERFAQPWDTRLYGLNMDAARRITVNTWIKARLTPDQLLCAPKTWAALEYTAITDPDISGTVEWTAERAETGHGLCVWFDAELIEGVGFSNAPDAPELIYGSAFFPWEQPVALSPGDRIAVTLAADLIGDDYLWRWQTRVTGADGQAKAAFRQSTFYGVPLALEPLRRRAAEHVPQLSEAGQLDRFILNLMDGGAALAEIARQARQRFPNQLADDRRALAYAADLSQKYGK